MEKEIVILAKSSKRGRNCIAGIDTKTGRWVRPISDDTENEGAIPDSNIFYEDGNQVEILDRVKIQIVSHNPTKCQPENYLYDSSYYWEKTGRSSIEEVIKFRGYDEVERIFYNTGKEVSEHEIGGEPSLLLLKVENPCVFIKTFKEQKIQLNFEYKNVQYKYFKISDKAIKSKYTSESDGQHDRRSSLDVVFSLTDKYLKSGKYYKMVAQIFY